MCILVNLQNFVLFELYRHHKREHNYTCSIEGWRHWRSVAAQSWANYISSNQHIPTSTKPPIISSNHYTRTFSGLWHHQQSIQTHMSRPSTLPAIKTIAHFHSFFISSNQDNRTCPDCIHLQQSKQMHISWPSSFPAIKTNAHIQTLNISSNQDKRTSTSPWLPSLQLYVCYLLFVCSLLCVLYNVE